MLATTRRLLGRAGVRANSFPTESFRSCPTRPKKSATLSFNQKHQQNWPGRAGEYQSHFERSCRAPGRANNDVSSRGDCESEDEERTSESLNMTEQASINSDKVHEIMTILADGIVELAAIHRRPRRNRKYGDKENGEPERKLHPAVRSPLNGVDLYSDAVMRERFHVNRWFRRKIYPSYAAE